MKHNYNERDIAEFIDLCQNIVAKETVNSDRVVQGVVVGITGNGADKRYMVRPLSDTNSILTDVINILSVPLQIGDNVVMCAIGGSFSNIFILAKKNQSFEEISTTVEALQNINKADQTQTPDQYIIGIDENFPSSSDNFPSIGDRCSISVSLGNYEANASWLYGQIFDFGQIIYGGQTIQDALGNGYGQGSPDSMCKAFQEDTSAWLNSDDKRSGMSAAVAGLYYQLQLFCEFFSARSHQKDYALTRVRPDNSLWVIGWCSRYGKE